MKNNGNDGKMESLLVECLEDILYKCQPCLEPIQHELCLIFVESQQISLIIGSMGHFHDLMNSLVFTGAQQ